MAPKLGTSIVINTPGARGVEAELPTEIPELAEGVYSVRHHEFQSGSVRRHRSGPGGRGTDKVGRRLAVHQRPGER